MGKIRAPLLIGGGLAGYAWAALSGPQGVQSLLEKHRTIRQLQEQNAEAAQENQRRLERIQRLEKSQSEQEIEIRKQLKKQREGETTFILPDAPAEAPPADSKSPDSKSKEEAQQ